MIWIALTLCTVSFHALSAEENPSIEECQKRLDATGWTFASIQSKPEELEGFKVKSPKGPKVRLTSPSGTKMSYMEWKPSKRVETPDKGKLKAIEGVKDVHVTIVWDPPWGPEMISPEGRQKLGME